MKKELLIEAQKNWDAAKREMLEKVRGEAIKHVKSLSNGSKK